MMIDALLLIGCLLLGQANAPVDQETRLLVRRFARQLDDDLLAQREAAEQALIELGPAILELLPSATRNTSAEVRVRLARIRQKLQAVAAEAAAQPSRITLQGEMPLAEALAALEQQSGNRIVDFRARQRQQQTNPNVTADYRETPFWQALDDLFDQAGLTVYNFSGEQGAVAFVARSETESDRGNRAAYAGLFRLEGTSIHATRDLRDPANRSLRLNVQVTWEPRVSPIVLQIPLSDIQVTDNAGDSLGLDAGMTNLEVPVENAIPAAEITIPLGLPDRSVQEIASLRGTMSAIVPGQIETFEFDNLEDAKMVEQTRADVTVILEQVRKNVAVHEVRMRARFATAGNALESHRGWVYDNEACLMTSDKKRIEHIGMQTFRQTPTEVGLSYLFDGEQKLEGCQFVYKTPATLVSLPVQYELKDIPLP